MKPFPVLSSLRSRCISALRRLGIAQRAGAATGWSRAEWFAMVSDVNRYVLTRPESRALESSRLKSKPFSQSAADGSWKTALNALGSEWCHRGYGHGRDLEALEAYFSFFLDSDGNWTAPIDRGECAMKGYTLTYLAQQTGDPRYRQAVDRLARALVVLHPRTADGSLPYRPNDEQILVDTLAMICPFLARYARLYGAPAARDVSVNQLVQFLRANVDEHTHLPYHGYYADGPKRLGMHAWGRGTGWYMMGLIDTLLEIPPDHADYDELLGAYLNAAESLRRFQRQDGHWNWAILHRKDVLDSSTTSLVGYSLARGLGAAVLDQSFTAVIDAAIQALKDVTRPDGVLYGSLGECRGLGKYPQQYGPTPWLQGSATAFAALYLAGDELELGGAP